MEKPPEVETAPSGADEYIIGTHMMGSVNALCVPKDGLLISVGDDKGIQLWDLAAEKMLKRMENNRIVKCIVAMSETTIATGNEDGTIKIWDVDPDAVNEEGAPKKWSQRARRLNTLEGHASAVNGLAQLGDTTLISGSSDGTLMAWETDTGTCSTKLEGHEGAVNDVIAVDSNTLASCSADKSIKIWKFAPEEPGGSSMTASWDECHKAQNVLCLERISDTVIASGGGGTRPLPTCPCVSTPIRLPVCRSPEKLLLLAERSILRSADMLAKVWDLADGGTLAALKGHTSAVQALAVIGDRMLATGNPHPPTP